MGTAYTGFVYAHNQNRKASVTEAAELESIKTEKNQKTEQHDAVNMNAISGL